MSAQTTPDQSFPTPCKRCGGVLYQQVDFCPYCGADHPLDTVVRKRAEAPLKAVSPPLPPPAALSAPDVASAELPPVAPEQRQIHPLEAPSPIWQSAGRWIFTKGMLAVWFVLALAYVAYLLLGESRKHEPVSDETSTNSSGGSISPYAPQQANLAPRAGDQGTPSAVPKPRVMPQYKDVADSLRAARTSLQYNNLSDAKAATHAALTREANNADALALERDIAAREQRRDIALQSADKCASERAWPCVRQYASEALAADSSSVHAQTLMERVILSTGWSPLASVPTPSVAAPSAPASRRGNNAGLPSSRDWGKAAPPATSGWSASAPPPPLPRANSMPAATATPPAASTDENTPAGTGPAAAASADTGNPGNANSTSTNSTNSTNDNSVDATERAIRESGWKHAAPASAPR